MRPSQALCRGTRRHALRRNDRIVFLVDEDTGPSAAEGIELAGGCARLVRDVFGESAKDPDWLPKVSEHAHALLTRDISQRRKPAERDLIMALDFDAGVFVIRAGDLTRDGLRALTREHYYRMAKMVHTCAMPFVAHVTQQDVILQVGGEKLPKKWRLKPAL